MMECYCNSRVSYTDCCEPLHLGKQLAANPEQLMRSRYSAYCIKRWDYILNTYAAQPRARLSTSELAHSAGDTQWITLVINSLPAQDKVEFSAYYADGNALSVLRETSRFVQEDGVWRYLDGELHNCCGKVTIGRNDPCICASGRKFKQCCYQKL
jgi:SEC-C motif-containing protein